MMTILTLLSAWQLMVRFPTPSYQFQQLPTNVFMFSSSYPSFLVVTQLTSMNLSNATIQCSFNLTNSDDVVFRFGGQGVSNFGPRPASARLFFSAVYGYHNQGTGSTNYWFNSNWVEIGTNTVMQSLTVTVNSPEGWSDAGGCFECPATTTNNFWYGVQNVHEIGLAFGGGDFYDVGITTTTGVSQFNLLSFSVDPIVTINTNLEVEGGFSQSVYNIEQTEDLVNWHSITNNADSKFYRAKLTYE